MHKIIIRFSPVNRIITILYILNNNNNNKIMTTRIMNKNKYNLRMNFRYKKKAIIFLRVKYLIMPI